MTGGPVFACPPGQIVAEVDVEIAIDARDTYYRAGGPPRARTPVSFDDSPEARCQLFG